MSEAQGDATGVKRRVLLGIALTKAVVGTVWAGAALAFFTALFGVTYPQYADVAFSAGWLWIIAADVLDLGFGLAMASMLGGGGVWRDVGKVLGMVGTATVCTIAGYLAFYSLAASVYVSLGSRDVSADIEAVELYRMVTAPVSNVLTEYFDDVLVGLVATALGGLLAGFFRGFGREG